MAADNQLVIVHQRTFITTVILMLPALIYMTSQFCIVFNRTIPPSPGRWSHGENSIFVNSGSPSVHPLIKELSWRPMLIEGNFCVSLINYRELLCVLH